MTLSDQLSSRLLRLLLPRLELSLGIECSSSKSYAFISIKRLKALAVRRAATPSGEGRRRVGEWPIMRQAVAS
jgi:hypothetical protein